jgi:hypothetical protein
MNCDERNGMIVIRVRSCEASVLSASVDGRSVVLRSFVPGDSRQMWVAKLCYAWDSSQDVYSGYLLQNACNGQGLYWPSMGNRGIGLAPPPPGPSAGDASFVCTFDFQETDSGGYDWFVINNYNHELVADVRGNLCKDDTEIIAYQRKSAPNQQWTFSRAL